MEITPELQQKMVGIVEYLEIAIKQSAEFAADQAPEVVQQLLVWNAVSSAISFTVSLVMCIILPFITWKMYKHFKEQNKDDYYARGLEYFSFLLLGLYMPFVIVVSESMDWLKIWIAPKLYLLEYASSLLK